MLAAGRSGADDQSGLEHMNAGRRDRVERRLAAILAADVAGYSRLMAPMKRARCAS
jgi:class 3 adenylate cyclase